MNFDKTEILTKRTKNMKNENGTVDITRKRNIRYGSKNLPGPLNNKLWIAAIRAAGQFVISSCLGFKILKIDIENQTGNNSVMVQYPSIQSNIDFIGCLVSDLIRDTVQYRSAEGGVHQTTFCDFVGYIINYKCLNYTQDYSKLQRVINAHFLEANNSVLFNAVQTVCKIVNNPIAWQVVIDVAEEIYIAKVVEGSKIKTLISKGSSTTEFIKSEIQSLTLKLKEKRNNKKSNTEESQTIYSEFEKKFKKSAKKLSQTQQEKVMIGKAYHESAGLIINTYLGRIPTIVDISDWVRSDEYNSVGIISPKIESISDAVDFITPKLIGEAAEFKFHNGKTNSYSNFVEYVIKCRPFDASLDLLSAMNIISGSVIGSSNVYKMCFNSIKTVCKIVDDPLTWNVIVEIAKEVYKNKVVDGYALESLAAKAWKTIDTVDYEMGNLLTKLSKLKAKSMQRRVLPERWISLSNTLDQIGVNPEDWNYEEIMGY